LGSKRNLIILAVAVLLIGFGYYCSRDNAPSETVASEESEEQTVNQENLGQDESEKTEPVLNMGPDKTVQDSEAKRIFAMVVEDMGQCLEIKAPEAQADVAVDLQTVVLQFQSDLGPGAQNNKWQSWVIKTPNGKERRYRLDEKIDFDGALFKEIEGIEIAEEGAPVPIVIDADKSINPSQEVIDKLLSEGNVTGSERAGFVTFQGGERLDYIERNGQLSEVEFVRGDRFFRCGNILDRSSCQCMR
jgi:hypothetical protein